ncbi:thiol-disulfide oxidoreductase DCC family protein [Singulisphaera rosea]
MNHWRFKILYDGQCPFCRHEARWLGHLNRSGHLALEDIAAPDFDPGRYGPTTTLDGLMGTIHGVFPDGRITRGMETFRQAYGAVGLGWVLAPTGWPVIRPIFDALYRLFARYRLRLGRVFGSRCASDRCSLGGDSPIVDEAKREMGSNPAAKGGQE